MMKINWERLSAVLVASVLGVGAAYVAFRFLLPLLFPFLVAWAVSLAIVPLSRRLAHFLHLPCKLCSVVLLGGAVLLGAWGLWAGGVRVLSELLAFINRMIEEGTLASALDDVTAWLDGLGLPFDAVALSGSLRQMLDGALSALSTKIPDVLGRVLGALPRLFFVVVITVISGFYFCIDGERIHRALYRVLPLPIRSRIPACRRRMREISWKFLRAYLLLLCLTFFLLLVGFLVLGVDYAFLLALLIALADLLPVIGVGTVMVPWAVVLLLRKNFFLGFGILLLYLACELTRQIAEPRLVGKSLGLHPLAALFASYVGFCLFGFFGLLTAPIVATVGKTLLSKAFFTKHVDNV